MADSSVKLVGPSGIPYNELHNPVATGRDAQQVGPVVALDKYEDGKIYVITINRPHRMNSLGSGVPLGLHDAFAEFRDDKNARVAILTGRGSRAFSAGADLIETSERRKAEAAGLPVPDYGPPRPWVPLAEGMGVWKPVIGAINGFALAGGFNVAMQTDIRIAAEHARIGIAEVRWNMPGAGWMIPMTRQIGLGIALELTLWGDTQFTAQRAYEVGWVNKVVPADQLMETAMEYARRAIDMAPRDVRNIKQALYRGFYLPPQVAMAFGQAIEQNLVGMKDSIEGPTAFAEKRRPNFTDS